MFGYLIEYSKKGRKSNIKTILLEVYSYWAFFWLIVSSLVCIQFNSKGNYAQFWTTDDIPTGDIKISLWTKVSSSCCHNNKQEHTLDMHPTERQLQGWQSLTQWTDQRRHESPAEQSLAKCCDLPGTTSYSPAYCYFPCNTLRDDQHKM